MLVFQGHRILGILLTGIAVILATACTTSTLCGGPLTDDKRLSRAIDHLLQPLTMNTADYGLTLQQIERLLLKEPCVREVEFDQDIVATEPAIVYGRLTLGEGDQVFSKKLTLRFSGQKIWLEKIE